MSFKKGLFWIGLMISTLTCSMSVANAQIFNMQNVLRGKVPEGFSLQAETSWEKKSGNSEVDRFLGQASPSWREGPHLWLAVARREYGEQGGKQSLDNSFYHLRYRYSFDEALSLETFLQQDSDRFRRRASRQVYGLGPYVKLLDSESVSLALSIAPMYERESISEAEGYKEERTKTRVSSMLYIDWKWQPHVLLSNVFYVQPKIDRWSDRRVLNEAALQVSLAEQVSLKTAYSLTYDALPPAGVKRTDTSVKQALVLNF